MVRTRARMSDSRLSLQLLYDSVEGKNQRGRPLGRWKDRMIENDLRKRNVVSWYDIVQDRVAWRTVVHGEIVDAGMRRRIKWEAKGENEKNADGDKPNLVCPNCGKGYLRTGWLQKHLARCGKEYW